MTLSNSSSSICCNARVAWIAACVLLVSLSPISTVAAADQSNTYVVDVHSHTKSGPFTNDDGSQTLASQADIAHAAGYDVIFHTPHSDYKSGPQKWLQQREHERNGLWSLLRYLGEEVTVAKGPNWAITNGRKNNDHLGVIGQDGWIPHQLPMKAASERAHATGAVVTLNHPGPSPGMWEVGYWTRPAIHDKLDAIEVCNGQLMHFVRIDFFTLYQHAVSYGGWGVKLAAVGGTDSHAAKDVPQVATLVVAPDDAEATLVEAIRQRQTYVVYRLIDLRLHCDQLGKTIHTTKVDLTLNCSRKVESIKLYREGQVVKSWSDTDHAEFKETIADNAAYTWQINDGAGRAYSSAIWYEPNPIMLPDLLVDMQGSSLHEQTLTLAIKNTGRFAAEDVVVEVWSDFAAEGGTLLARHTFTSIAPASSEQTTLSLDAKADRPIFIRIDPESYNLEDDDAIKELDERNNCALLSPLEIPPAP